MKQEHKQKLSHLLESLLTADKPLINTGVLSQSPAQFASLWALREGIPEAASKEGKTYKYDISVPVVAFKDVVEKTRHRLESKGLIGDKAVKCLIGYGHVGDGGLIHNLHDQALKIVQATSI
jgi:FAD/FMN-containing dehydrogenase